VAFRLTPARRVLLNTMLAATALRLFRLGALSLWFDEGATWTTSMRGTWSDAWAGEANHPPLWRLVTRAWVLAFGDSESSLRFPAAILGVVSVYLFHLLSRRLTSPALAPSRGGFRGVDAGAGAWATGLAAAAAFWIQYAQEARPYSALLAESLGLHLLYLRWLDRGGRGTLAGYAALAAAALYTHYFAAWILLAHVLHVLWLRRTEAGQISTTPRPANAPTARIRANPEPAGTEAGRISTIRGGPRVRPWPLFAAQAAAAVAFVPWLVHFLQSFHGISPPRAANPFLAMAYALWRMGVGDGLAVADRARMDAGPDALLNDERLLIVATNLIWFVPILFGLWALRRDRGTLSFVLAAALVPIVATLAMSPRWPLIHEKYLIEVAPFLLLLAVVGARSLPSVPRGALVLCLVAMHGAGLAAYHVPESRAVDDFLVHGHPFGKESWREAHAWIEARSEPGDLVLLHPGLPPNSLTLVWDYYDRGRSKEILLPSEPLTAEHLLARFPALATAKRAFLVLSHEETPDKDHYARVLRDLWIRTSEGGFSFDREDFPRHWGVRVHEFRRE
jgi:uncharacterized membrane protein